MEDKDLIVGARVAFKFDKYSRWDDPHKGKVLTTERCPSTGKTKVLVKWDSKYSRLDAEVFADQLLLETEADALHSKLEREFDDLASQLKGKMDEAAKLVREASKIAKDHKFKLKDMDEAYTGLYNAMDEAGWNTSSFSC